MQTLLLGGSLMTALLAGMLAFLAPCCIAMMLPAFTALTVQHEQRALLPLMALFTLGLATVTLPITLGLAAIEHLLTASQAVITIIGGLIVTATGIYTLTGGRFAMPTVAAQEGPPSVHLLHAYGLGIVSGVNSLCCISACIGVIAMASLTPSFIVAFVLGVAYVSGMVLPLFALTLLSRRVNWRKVRWLRLRPVTLRLGNWRKSIAGSQFISGLLLVVIGPYMLISGFTLRSAGRIGGWQATVTITLQHWITLMSSYTKWMPGWVILLILVAVVAFVWHYHHPSATQTRSNVR